MKDLSVCDLLDVYGELLNEKQYRLAWDYYSEDLSLSEISENEGLTRQAAHELIKRATALLYSYEEKLKYLTTKNSLKEAVKNNDKETVFKIIEQL